MRIETVIHRLRERQKALEEGIFSKPPGEWMEFKKQQGIWQGLGDALRIIAEEAQKDREE